MNGELCTVFGGMLRCQVSNCCAGWAGEKGSSISSSEGLYCSPKIHIAHFSPAVVCSEDAQG